MPASLILASSSPQRASLLERMGVEFRISPSRATERAPDLPPAELARFLALRKAEAIRRIPKGRLVLAADTLVALRGAVLGKPRSAGEAVRQLRLLEGKEHRVITGMALKDPCRGMLALSSECSLVSFRRLSEKEILNYVETGEPRGKAGSYAIQGMGRLLISRLRGDYYNVVGLPVALFASMARSFGLRIPVRRIEKLYREIPARFRRNP